MIKKVKTIVLWTYVIKVFNGEETKKKKNELQETKLQNANQTEFRIEKVTKKKGDELYVKRKDFDKLFNSWIYKKT